MSFVCFNTTVQSTLTKLGSYTIINRFKPTQIHSNTIILSRVLELTLIVWLCTSLWTDLVRTLGIAIIVDVIYNCLILYIKKIAQRDLVDLLVTDKAIFVMKYNSNVISDIIEYRTINSISADPHIFWNTLEYGRIILTKSTRPFYVAFKNFKDPKEIYTVLKKLIDSSHIVDVNHVDATEIENGAYSSDDSVNSLG